MMNLPAPDFTLPDLDNGLHSQRDYRGRVVILQFWSAECPWSARADRELSVSMQAWEDSVVLLSIASNANEAPELLARVAAERGLHPVLRDADLQVADLYSAITTPHYFLVDAQGVLRYQGSLDDATFYQRTPTRHYLREAVEAVLAGRNPDPAQTPPYGCALVRYAI